MLRYEDRRKTFYTDKSHSIIDPIGTDIWQCCMEEVQKLLIRLSTYDKPVSGLVESALAPPPGPPNPNPEIKSLPRIAARPAIADVDITVAPPPPSAAHSSTKGQKMGFLSRIAEELGEIVKAHGQQSQNQLYNSGSNVTAAAPTKLLSKTLPNATRSVIHKAKTTATTASSLSSSPSSFSSGQNPSPVASLLASISALSPANIKHAFRVYFIRFIHSAYAIPIRQSFARRATAVVAGVPRSDLSSLMDAISILVELVARSPAEDTYGFVAPRVVGVVKVYGAAIGKLEAFKRELQPHWTDVEFREEGSGGNSSGGGSGNEDRKGGKESEESNDRNVKAVDDLIRAFKRGLERIIITVAEFADAVGLTEADLKEAKMLVGSGEA